VAVITHSASLEQDELILQSLKNICGDQDKGRVLRGKADDEYEAGFSLYQEEATGLFHLNSDETDKATREIFFVYREDEGGSLEIDWSSLREKNFRVRSARVLLVVQTILSEHVVSRGNKGYAIRRSGLLRVTERKVEDVFDLFTRYRDFDHLADELLGLSASVSINDHLGSPKDLRKWSVIREGMIVVFQPPWKVSYEYGKVLRGGLGTMTIQTKEFRGVSDGPAGRLIEVKLPGADVPRKVISYLF